MPSIMRLLKYALEEEAKKAAPAADKAQAAQRESSLLSPFGRH